MKNWIHFSARRGNGRKLCGKRTGRLQNRDSVTPHFHASAQKNLKTQFACLAHLYRFACGQNAKTMNERN